MTEEQWDAVIAVNLKSVFNFTKAVQPIMWKQGKGSIVNMSSVVGVSGNAQANYSASKAGINWFYKIDSQRIGIGKYSEKCHSSGFYNYRNDPSASRGNPQ